MTFKIIHFVIIKTYIFLHSVDVEHFFKKRSKVADMSVDRSHYM